MFRPIAVLLVSALLSATPSFAAETVRDKNDTGKKLILKLFQDVIAPASESTVRIQSAGKDIALGTIVSKDGYILTKGSELRKQSEISCKLRDGTAYDAEYLGYHRESDLALLKIEGFDLKPVVFAPAKAVELGNWVAIPGIDSDPLAVGVISATARKLYGDEMQIENANKGYLGISFGIEGGPVVIKALTPGASAEKAGLKVDDTVIEVAGKAIKDREKLQEIMDSYKPGDVITVKVQRKVKDSDEPEEKSFRVTLSPRSAMSRGDMQNAFGGQLSGRRTGFPKVIQHDSVVDPKDCGGPLVDLEGRIVGLNIARAGRVETWALPGDVVMAIYKDLKAGKYPIAEMKTKSEK